MEHKAVKKTSELLSAPVSESIIVAINGRENSKYVVEWALEKLPRENITFELLYVSAKITSLPTPMEVIPISQVPEDIAAAYRQEIEWKNNDLLDIYKKMFARKKVPVDVVNVEGDDIAQAIADEVNKSHANKLVIGASSRGGMFTRKINGEKYSSKITEMIPKFCTVYSVSKGKLLSVDIGRCKRNEAGSFIPTKQTDHERLPNLYPHIDSDTNSTSGRASVDHERLSNLYPPIGSDPIPTSPENENTFHTFQDTAFGPMQVQQYKKFTWEEIVDATSSFSDNYIIGQEASGTIYKCNLDSTIAAVKVLDLRDLQIAKRFQQELEISSRIRHPYLLLLIGACPEHGCLVYEYMEKGSLEDRLFQRNDGRPPIPWFDRFRIAWEIASGLMFLHYSKPNQIIHRDLKPANILLDHNLGSKIANVGLSKMVNSVDASAMSMFVQTNLVGTLSYIDPEYAGEDSTKSDVYAFGMILLQLLTAKTTKTLTHLVETAVKAGNLMKLLDHKAGPWPLEEAKELAILGLSCAKLRRIDRPDLKDHVLPKLEILRAAADRARDAVHNSLSAPPSNFLPPIIKEVMNEPCVASDGYTYDEFHNSLSSPPSHFVRPIIKEVMNEPCVASDGHTYDSKLIETWLGANDISLVTNVTLPTKDLILNFALVSAVFIILYILFFC